MFLRLVLLLTCISALVVPQVQRNNAGNQITSSQTQGQTQPSSKSSSQKPADPISNAKYIEHKDCIPYQYIVRLNNGLSDQQAQNNMNQVNELQKAAISKYPKSHPFFKATARFQGAPSTGGIVESYNAVKSLRMYLGYFVDEVISDLRKNTLVASIEQVPRLAKQVEDQRSKPASKNAAKSSKAAKPQKPFNKRTDTKFVSQSNAPWHLRRLNKVNFDEVTDFNYYEDAGLGVDIYVLDSGVNGQVEDLAQRVINIGKHDITHNHGTCVASIAAGSQHGVAKKGQVISIFVAGSGDAYFADIVQGISSVIVRHQEQQKKPNFLGSVVNISMGGPYCEQLDILLKELRSMGVHVVVSAGNFFEDQNHDSCLLFPSSSENVITVGSTTSWGDISLFSGDGSCVDIYASGEDISCALYTDPSGSDIMDGTSMSTPIVTGIIATLLSFAPSAGSGFSGTNAFTPEKMKNSVLSLARSAGPTRPQGFKNWVLSFVGRNSEYLIAFLGNSEETLRQSL